MIGIDMPGQLKENDCSRTIAIAQNLNPHFPFPNRIDLSRTVKWCHLWSTGSLCYFVFTPLCAQRSSHVCWYMLKDLSTSADICTQNLAHLLIFAHSRSLHVFWYLPTDLCTSTVICQQQIFARLLIFALRSFHVCWYLPKDLCTSADICPNLFARLMIYAHNRSLHVCWYWLTIFIHLLISAKRSLHIC